MALIQRKNKLKAREEDREQHKRIDEIFKTEAEKVDMTRLEPVKKGRRKRILWILISFFIALLLVTLFGFWYFTRERGKYTGKSIDFEVTAPESLASGEEIVLLLNYHNKEKVALKNINLNVRSPEGFYYSSATPSSYGSTNNTWDLGTIEASESGQVKILGKLVGEVGATKKFVFTFNYSPANFSSNFYQEFNYLVNLTASVLDIKIEAPARAIGDQEITYKANYTNNSSMPLENFRLLFFYPDDFEFISGEPQAKSNNNLWQIDKLESGESGEIIIKGILKGEPGELKEMKIQMLLRDENNNYNPQMEKSHLILIVSPGLELILKVNDNQEGGPLNWGDTLNYEINYKNTGDLEIKDIVLEITVAGGKILDLSNLDPTNQGVLIDNNYQISWDKERIKELASLIPEEEGKINFSLKLLPSVTIDDESDKNFLLNSKVVVKSLTLGDLEGTGFKAESNEVVNNINTNLNLQSEGRYYSEEFEQWGSGPLPPEVGRTTTYRIYWYLSNTTNTVSAVEVKTTLPADVFWTGQSHVTAGKNLSFNSENRQVTWEINQIPPQAGFLLPSLEAWFEVSITPTNSQVGKTLTLIENSEVKAIDSLTGTSINLSVKKVTTELANDVGAQGKGKVVSRQNRNSNLNNN